MLWLFKIVGVGRLLLRRKYYQNCIQKSVLTTSGWVKGRKQECATTVIEVGLVTCEEVWETIYGMHGIRAIAGFEIAPGQGMEKACIYTERLYILCTKAK